MIACEKEPLQRWIEERSIANRNDVVRQFDYLCRRAAKKFVRPGIDVSDLRQVAALGLLKATERYDPTLETPFEAYAWLFVIGELMHYVRDYERLVRAPRSVRALESRYARTRELLVERLQREPTEAELGAELHVDARSLDAVRRLKNSSVPQPLEGERMLEARVVAARGEPLNAEDRILLERALARLTLKERVIVLGVFGRGMTQCEIGERLGYSQRHVSRLLRMALEKMSRTWV